MILVLSLLPLIGVFATPHLLRTQDGLVHLPRMAAYFKALADGEIPVRWAGDLNYGYGMPLFNFIYPLPYWVSSFFIFLGLGLANSFKAVLAISFILSGVFMFAFAKNFFGDLKKAFLVTVFYQFAPFRLIDLLVRGGMGEIYAYVFLPLVLLGITLIFKKPSIRSFLLTSLATGFLVLSHNSISLVFFATVFLFVIFFSKKIKDFIYASSSLGVGLLLSSFYFLPAILEHKYTYGDLFMKNLYLEHFAPIQKFFIPNFLNSPSLQIGGVSVQIGLFHLIAVFLSVILLFKKRKDPQRLIIFSIVIFIVSFFFMTSFSKPLWANISLLRQFQFPWRFLAVISFATSLLSVNFLNFPLFRKKWVYILLVVLVIASTAYYWRPPLGYDKINEDYYWNFPLNTTYYGETDVIWSEGPAKSYPKSRVDVISGQAQIKNFIKKGNMHTFSTIAEKDTQLADRTEYYPGWTVFIDGKKAEIQYQDPHNRGEITFWVPAGEHHVEIKFLETKLRAASDFISLATAVLLLILFFISFNARKIKIAGVLFK